MNPNVVASVTAARKLHQCLYLITLLLLLLLLSLPLPVITAAAAANASAAGCCCRYCCHYCRCRRRSWAASVSHYSRYRRPSGRSDTHYLCHYHQQASRRAGRHAATTDAGIGAARLEPTQLAPRYVRYAGMAYRYGSAGIKAASNFHVTRNHRTFLFVKSFIHERTDPLLFT